MSALTQGCCPRAAVAAGLVLCLAAPGARAAEVCGVAGSARKTTLYLALGPGEKPAVGAELKGADGRWKARVVEVVGRKARAMLIGRRRPAAHARTLGVSAAAPARPGGARWPVRASLRPRASAPGEVFWARQRLAARRLVPVPRRPRGEAGPPARGDLSLGAAAVYDVGGDRSWAVARLRTRLDVPSLLGGRMWWHHDVSLLADGASGWQGGGRARRLLAVREAALGTRLGGVRLGLGRAVVGGTSGASLIDGLTGSLDLGDWGGLEVFGGTAPDPVSLAPEIDAARFGVTLRAHTTNRRRTCQAHLGYVGQLVQGHLDPHRLGLGLFADHRDWGQLQADMGVAFGGADLSGTVVQARRDPGLQLQRALLSATTNRDGGWLLRLRYSFHRPLLDRLYALSLPWDVFVDATSHLLLLEYERGGSRGWWWRPALTGAYLSGPERLDGPRLALALRAGYRGERWAPRASLHVESGLATTTDGMAAGPTRGAGLWLGTRYRLNPALALNARLGGRWDAVLPSGDDLLRGRARAGVQWVRGPWLVAIDAGADKVLAATPFPKVGALDWLDATLLVRRRLP